MSTDCLCEYHGRASRDTLRVWSGWASTVIHGPLLGSDSDSADWSLHIAGPDNPDRATRLHLLGPAAIGSGPGRRRRSGVGQSGMDRAEGGDYS